MTRETLAEGQEPLEVELGLHGAERVGERHRRQAALLVGRGRAVSLVVEEELEVLGARGAAKRALAVVARADRHAEAIAVGVLEGDLERAVCDRALFGHLVLTRHEPDQGPGAPLGRTRQRDRRVCQRRRRRRSYERGGTDYCHAQRHQGRSPIEVRVAHGSLLIVILWCPRTALLVKVARPRSRL